MTSVRTRRPLRFVALVWLALLALAALPTAPAVQAHASYVRSDPPSGGQLATPGRIRVVFTEDVDPGFSELQVLDSSRRRVDLRDTSPVPNDPKSLNVSVPQLPDGTYTVAWKTLSAVDGHTIRGAFPLVVGAGAPSGEVAESYDVPVDPLEVLIRGLYFAGTLLLFGGFAFIGLVFAPALATLRDRGAVFGPLRAEWERRYVRAGLLLVVVLAVVSLVWLAQQVANAAGVSLLGVFGDPLARFLRTRNFQLWAVKALVLLAIGACLLNLRGRPLVLAGAALSALLLLGTSLTSHAAALARGPELGVTVDWLHQVGAAVWLGGLSAALVLLPAAIRLEARGRAALLSAVVPRLSAASLGAVVVLIATGVFGVLVQVGRPEAFATTYGVALLVKIGGLLPMLVLGALNLFLFKPRFARAAERGRAALGSAVALARRFRLVVAGEIALGVAVLFATGVLTSAVPAREVWGSQPRPIELSGRAEDLRIDVRVEPGRVGENTFTIDVRDESGGPAANVQRVQLRFVYLDQELGRGTRIAEPQGERFVIQSSDLSVAGSWQLEVAVRRMNREDSVTAFRFEVGAPAGEMAGSAILLPVFTSPLVPLAFALLLGGLALAVWNWYRPLLRKARREGLSMACALVALAAALVLVRSASFGPDLRSLRNPFPPTSASLARGKELYFANGCADCHGETGRGDGPAGRVLRPRPADFRIHMAAGHTDGELYDWITNGVPGTAMPAFREQLTEEERWHLINFIRTFAESEAAEAPAASAG